MTLLRVTGGKVLRNRELEQNGILWVDTSTGKVVPAPQDDFNSANVDARGCIVAPGFIDIQNNGSFGVDLSLPGLSAEGVTYFRRQLLQHGVTSVCPTVVTSDPETYRAVLELIAPAKGSPTAGACIIGAHLEGPFIDVSKKGAHKENFVQTPHDGFESLLAAYGVDTETLGRTAAIVTLAPELDGATDAIRGLCDAGVRVAFGHTAATLEDGERAMDEGATLITHLFNAMPALHHRDPGLLGLLGTCVERKQRLSFGIIADGIHAHPAVVKLAYDAHPAGCILVTDAMPAMGLPPGELEQPTPTPQPLESTN